MPIDILIKNVQLRNNAPGKLKSIEINQGLITAITDKINIDVKTIIDAQGNLVTESFVNPHLHLDKVYTLDRMNEDAMQNYHGGDMGKAMTAIEKAADVKTQYQEEWLLENIRKALNLAIKNGNTHIRAFADVDSKAKLTGVKALLKAKTEYKDKLLLQIVAFPQDGVEREPGTEELIRQSMELGADVVGGIPWIEFTEKDIQTHIDKMFSIAKEFDKPVSMLVDDAGDAGLRSLEKMAIKTIEQGWQGRSLAHHARAMHLYPKPYFQKVSALLKKAEMSLVTDPHTGPLHARVKEMLFEGNEICLGQDDISDAYYPFGQNNMLEVAFLASHMLWMTTRGEMEILYDMVTTKAATAMGIEGFALQVGNEANLVVLDQKNVLEALRFHKSPTHVIFKGNLI
jgi:cytosine/creatinine deaminase